MIDFLVIGAQKAGSSSLYFLLNKHPDICLTRTKEVNFFTKNYNKKSLKWYLNQFANHTKVLGDVSPSYSKRHIFRDTAKKVFEYNPKMKIVYLIRNPYDRIKSHLYHDLVTDRIRTSNNYAHEIKADSDYILTSSYCYQISEYLKYFSKDSIFILDSEDLNDIKSSGWRNLLNFLEVRTNVKIELKKYNKSEGKRRIKYYTIVYKYLNFKLFREIYFRVAKKFGEKIIKPELDSETKKTISSLLKSDYAKFDNIFSSNISKWLL